MKKLTRNQLVKRLGERLNEKDAKKVGSLIPIYSQSDFNELQSDYEKEEEEREGYCTLIYDMNIESIIGDLFYNGLTAEDIEREFLNFYSINSIVASESGEGLMLVQA